MIRDMNSNNSEIGTELLDASAVAKWLGVKVNTIYQWVHYKRVPFLKINGLLRFEYSAVEAFIKSSRHCGSM